MKAQQEQGQSPTYRIEINGHLGAYWATWFAGFALKETEDGNTILVGSIPDQAALHGVLRKIFNVGLTLVSVNQAPTSALPDNASEIDNQQEE